MRAHFFITAKGITAGNGPDRSASLPRGEGGNAGDERGIVKNLEGWLPCVKGAGIFRRKMTEGL